MKAAVTLLLHLVALLCVSRTVVQGLPLDPLLKLDKPYPWDGHKKSLDGEAIIARIETLETMNTALLNDVLALKTQNSALQSDLSALKTENSERKVAFSAGLGTDLGAVGPYRTEITLIFKDVVTNIGQAYNPVTGFFTAPLRGLYYFRFTAFDLPDQMKYVGVSLYLNSRQILWNSITYKDGTHALMSNALAVELQEGDVVYMKLPVGHVVFDDSGKLTTFTGFLLFTM